MKIAYVDTNIFDYVILRNEKYGELCKTILGDIGTRFDAICSFQVAAEILGSISSIDPILAYNGLLGFFSFNMRVVELSEKLLISAAAITKETKISGYDALHASVMKQENVKTIITENYKDFKKIKNIDVVRPANYLKWIDNRSD